MTGTTVRVKSPAGGWIAEIHLDVHHGPPAKVARRLRALGMTAVTQDGIVWVNADKEPRSGWVSISSP